MPRHATRQETWAHLLALDVSSLEAGRHLHTAARSKMGLCSVHCVCLPRTRQRSADKHHTQRAACSLWEGTKECTECPGAARPTQVYRVYVEALMSSGASGGIPLPEAPGSVPWRGRHPGTCRPGCPRFSRPATWGCPPASGSHLSSLAPHPGAHQAGAGAGTDASAYRPEQYVTGPMGAHRPSYVLLWSVG